MSSLDQFRQQTRAWLEANCPPSQRLPVVRQEQIWGGRHRVFPSDEAKTWFENMRDRGWTAPEWPTEYGGGGLSPAEAEILRKEMRKLGCRLPLYEIGIWMLGPALLKFGNPEQKAEHIPKIVRGEIRWSQGYSEPGAGSDLASLKTRADDAGDHFIVNGTKIWTTQADKSDWIFCLVRTDTEAPKQEGISFLLIDMESDGVSTTPIKLISGESEFCQTFFDDVKVPKENLVYELNKGWTVAKELLKHERKMMSSMGEMVESHNDNISELALHHVGRDAAGKLDDPVLRDQITEHLMRAEANLLSGLRLGQQMAARIPDAGLPLTMKYVKTTESQRKDELILAILGSRGLSWHDDEFSKQEHSSVKNWAFNKSLTIAGGTSEIQLNIIAKRALQLPD